MIEWFAFGCFVGFALPIIIRNRHEIIVYLKLRDEKP